MNSEFGIRNVGCVLALVMTFFTACTDYQEQFDNNFAALEYGDIENPELSSGVVPGSSHGATPASSASAPASSGVGPLSSGVVPTSSGAEPLSSGAVPASSGAEQSSSSTPPVVGNVLTDSRNGKEYRLVTIGSQVWMAENLNFETEKSRCYDNSNGNCLKYGRLYTWADAQSVCPEGTHLPSYDEFNALYKYVHEDNESKGSSEANFLKSKDGWKDYNGKKGGDDTYGFSALPAGLFADTGYVRIGESARFLTSDTTDDGFVSAFGMDYNNTVFVPSRYTKTYAISVRCLVGEKKAEVTSSSSAVATSCMVSEGDCFEDSRDHKTYRTVKIGQQTWMAENLKYYGSLEKVICYKDDSTYCKKYGGLYNISSTYSLQDVCPDGWHVPDSTEWNNLFVQAGGINDAGKYLKSETGWDKNGGGNDAFGFSALPGGYSTGRYASGSVQAGGGAYFLTSSELKSSQITNEVYVAQFYHDDSAAGLVSMEKDLYVSVRCIKGAKPSSSSSAKSSSSETSSSSIVYGSNGSFEYKIGGGTKYTSSYVSYNGLIWMNQDLVRSDLGHSPNAWSNEPKYFTWLEAQEACNIGSGWRLPSSDEIRKSGKLEENSSFNAKDALSGYFLYKKWHKKDQEGMYWTSTKNGDDYVDVFSLKSGEKAGKIVSVNVSFEKDAIKLPVRCVKAAQTVGNDPRDSSPSIKISQDSIFEDRYVTVTIGNQTWMAENFGWHQHFGSTGKCYNENPDLCKEYGYYYTYSTASKSATCYEENKWTLPTEDEVQELEAAVGGAEKLASVGMGGTNESQFDILPSGHFPYGGTFKKADDSNSYAACFWLFDTEHGDGNANAYCFTQEVSGGVQRINMNEHHPIRLILNPNCQ